MLAKTRESLRNSTEFTVGETVKACEVLWKHTGSGLRQLLNSPGVLDLLINV